MTETAQSTTKNATRTESSSTPTHINGSTTIKLGDAKRSLRVDSLDTVLDNISGPGFVAPPQPLGAAALDPSRSDQESCCSTKDLQTQFSGWARRQRISAAPPVFGNHKMRTEPLLPAARRWGFVDQERAAAVEDHRRRGPEIEHDDLWTPENGNPRETAPRKSLKCRLHPPKAIDRTDPSVAAHLPPLELFCPSNGSGADWRARQRHSAALQAHRRPQAGQGCRRARR